MMKELYRFDKFMQYALHHPDTGYYSRNIQTVGASGDFSTTATLSNVLGKAIAHSALEWAKASRTPLNIIEVGGGSGSLAASFIKSVPLLKRWRLNYHIVDSSTPLKNKQKKRNYLSKVIWHSEMEAALQACKGIAFIFSNELVDAFPVRIFQRSNDTWSELYLNQHRECFRACEDNLPDSSAIKNPATTADHRVEVHESYREWMQNWLQHWKKGQLLTIDYGDTHPEVYYRMPMGTLRAYSHHQRITGPAVYLTPGRQDITADVNFTDLMNWGKHDGLETEYFIEQREYLAAFVSHKPEDQFLVHPDGAGTAFKVLLQNRK